MKVVAYLQFPGSCEEALNFYKNSLNAEIAEISRMGDGQMEVPEPLKNKIMHAKLKVDDDEIFASDTFDPETIKQGNSISISLHPENIEKTEKIFNKLSAGGTVTMPLQDTFWGARFGMLVDKFGVNWMLNCETKK